MNSIRANRQPLLVTDCKKNSCDVCLPGADRTANYDMLPSAYMSMAKGG